MTFTTLFEVCKMFYFFGSTRIFTCLGFDFLGQVPPLFNQQTMILRRPLRPLLRPLITQHHSIRQFSVPPQVILVLITVKCETSNGHILPGSGDPTSWHDFGFPRNFPRSKTNSPTGRRNLKIPALENHP
jgi:hypothetical protein